MGVDVFHTSNFCGSHVGVHVEFCSNQDAA